MAAKTRISQSTVAELSSSEKPYIQWDSDIPGFGVRVMPTGLKTYILMYVSPVNGKQCKPKIGRANVMKAQAARQIAAEWYNDVTQGFDPQLEKSIRIEEQRLEENAMTVEQLCDKYLEEHALPYKSPQAAAEDEGKIARYILPAFGRKKAKEVLRSDVTTLFSKVSKRHPVAANRLIALIRKIFNFAIENQIPDLIDNPATHVKKNTEDPRDVYLNPDEINQVLGEIMKVENHTTRDFMLLCMVTGCRMAEAASAEWGHINMEEGVWRKPSSHTKQKRVHRLLLSPAALEILQGRLRTSQFVFPGTGASGHIDAKGHKKQWARIRVAIGRPEVRFYDAARHSFASLLQAKGANLQMIGKFLGHTQLATTQRYAHLYDDDMRDMTEKVGEIIDLKKHRSRSA
jgi:integrase